MVAFDVAGVTSRLYKKSSSGRLFLYALTCRVPVSYSLSAVRRFALMWIHTFDVLGDFS